MVSPEQSSSRALPPHVQLIQMATGGWVSRVTYAAARLGLADHLAEGPKTATELAGPLSVHEPSLHRLMRTLASLGVLTERGDRRFALTHLGEALKTGAPGSARASLLTIGSSWFNSSFDQIIYSLQTGKTVLKKPMACRYLIISRNIPTRHHCSARP
jgi:Dimerisation domain